jgi:hypothetical protein
MRLPSIVVDQRWRSTCENEREHVSIEPSNRQRTSDVSVSYQVCHCRVRQSIVWLNIKIRADDHRLYTIDITRTKAKFEQTDISRSLHSSLSSMSIISQSKRYSRCKKTNRTLTSVTTANNRS